MRFRQQSRMGIIEIDARFAGPLMSETAGSSPNRRNVVHSIATVKIIGVIFGHWSRRCEIEMFLF